MSQQVSQAAGRSACLSPRDLYRLRQTRLRLERAVLRARLMHQLLEEVTLELERRYGLLATDHWLDPRTGRVSPVVDGRRPLDLVSGDSHDP